MRWKLLARAGRALVSGMTIFWEQDGTCAVERAYWCNDVATVGSHEAWGGPPRWKTPRRGYVDGFGSEAVAPSALRRN